MASEAIITEELLCKAADQLAADGIRPTNETVRELLAKWTNTKGGSYATIGPVLRAWKARRKASESSDPVREAAPQVVVDKVQGWAAEMWRVALELANGRLASERESLERVRQELEVETAEALALAEKREDERDEARRQAGELIAQLDGAQVSIATQTQRAAAAEARATELEKRTHEVHDDLKAARSAAASAQEQARSDLIDLRKEHSAALTVQRTQHEAELSRIKETHQQVIHDQKQRSVDVIGKMESSKQRMESELDEARKAARDAVAQLARVSGELDALRSQVASQEVTIRGFTAVATQNAVGPDA